MTSNRPYLVRALYDWLVDNDMTPYLLVNAEHEQAVVPREFVDGGRIVLNISPTAVQDLQLGNDWITFSARFSGVSEEVIMPPQAILGIYAKENGKGMLFPDEDATTGDEPEDEPEPPKPGGRPSLKVVK